MSQPAIVVENLSKRYRIGTGGGPAYHRLSEMLTGLPRYAYNKLRSPRSISGPQNLTPDACHLKPSSDFWALKNVSFEIEQGEVVGIIGRNGAGKSTLLKILSRITEPTSGRFGVRGRVSSLLEVGTGFHPELTGRENIYVSGVTLGMTRAETKRRFDEIVDFSGVEKFLDTPVKHYSSGMQVRLGFSVAAHLESEILIVDEVLAVGDAEFQKKCLQRMRGVSQSGRTVLFVTHNMDAVTHLCSSGVLMRDGSPEVFADIRNAVCNYAGLSMTSNAIWTRPLPAPENSPSISHVEATNRIQLPNGQEPEVVVKLEYYVPHNVPEIVVAFVVISSDGVPLFASSPEDDGISCPSGAGRHFLESVIPTKFLLGKSYSIGVSLYSPSCGSSYEQIWPAVHFENADIRIEGFISSLDRVGEVKIPCKWRLVIGN